MDKKTSVALTAGVTIGLGISAAIIGCTVKKKKEAPKPDFFVVDGSNIVGLTEYGKKNIKNVLKIPHVIKGQHIYGIGPQAFAGLDISTVIISNGIIMIQDYAFANCINLKNVMLPKTLVQIFAHAFDGCDALEKLSIVGNIDTVETQSFANCENLRKVKIKSSAEVAHDAFMNDKNLEKMEFKK